MSNKHNFTFEVDVNVINHLGVGLYSSTPAALTELVANAWDADASNVWITIDPAANSIKIEDDGHGMDAAAIKGKFLHVGYSRRAHSVNKNFSNSGKRRVMGRKGIGKLAMFALSDLVKVSSQAAGSDIVGFAVDVPTLRSNLANHKSIVLDEFAAEPFSKGHGTRIELLQVLKGLNTTERFLRVRLARRFSVLGPLHNFRVHLNGKEITEADREIYDHVQFLWAFDQHALDRVSKLTKNLASIKQGEPPNETLAKCVELLPALVRFPDGTTSNVSGYIASVFQPKNLGSKEESANTISIFANGRVFAENILTEANSAKYYQNYLVGEIHADFLDDDEIDRATASREAIKRDDPRYQSLRAFVLSVLDEIGDKWDDWRTSLGLDLTVPMNQAVNEWLGTLTDARDIKTARRLMTSIQNATVHADETRNSEAKAVLYRGAIIGFEKLRIKQQLDRLSALTNVIGPEFAAIFSSLSEVEEAAYADITKQRLEIIRKFKSIAHNDAELEKVAQKYLFNHLWLLDPSWDRVSGRAEMEKTLTEHIKKVDPDSTGARLDITYRASSGRHIIVELKRPMLKNLKYIDLYEQARKYKNAVEQYYKDTDPGNAPPPLDIYLLISQTPVGFSDSDRRSLAEQSARIITYDKLINDAYNAYQEYLDINKVHGPLEAILAKL